MRALALVLLCAMGCATIYPPTQCSISCLGLVASDVSVDCGALERNHDKAIKALSQVRETDEESMCKAFSSITLELHTQPWHPMTNGFLVYGEFIPPSTVRVLLGDFPQTHRFEGGPLPPARYPHEFAHVWDRARGMSPDYNHVLWESSGYFRAEKIYTESQPELFTKSQITGAASDL